ncbi:hypothetical protein CARUB_v10024228mg [Capsella rubella]|uniref:Cyclin-dependent protein kinase inhibitor SMR3 n=1 Tax=Capsella rubella TaxID=81985 RepID=R0FZ46_9BRAS|nr:cyclin-dependent protein kinase inhibitor SMR10 [Capsella rubella]EOA28051.1 hypothetical protein CARUB_v10024228mg [Capsella rubella]
MGFSDAGVYLSDQNNLHETELGFLRESSLHASSPQHEFHIIPPRYQELQDQDQDLETKSRKTRNCSGKGGVNFKKEEEQEEEDYCKTPTRLDQILPSVPNICPPAPRKPKSTPSTRSLKVRNSYKSRRMIILNVSKEIDCLFNPKSLCNKIKKARYI